MINTRVPATLTYQHIGQQLQAYAGSLSAGNASHDLHSVVLCFLSGDEEFKITLTKDNADRIADTLKANLQPGSSQGLKGPGAAAIAVERAHKERNEND